jgi:hypothetical protein
MPAIAKRKIARAAKSRPMRLPPGASAEAVPAERRRGLRIRQSRPVKVFEPLSARYVAGMTRDVSSTGLRIELPASTAVRTGGNLTIHVGVSDQGQTLANRRSMIPARVIWLDRRIEEGRGVVTAGVEFVSSIAAHLDAA